MIVYNQMTGKNRKYGILIIILMLTLMFSRSSITARASVLPSDQESRLLWFGDSRTVFFGKAVYGYHWKKGVYPYTIINKHVVARRSATYKWASGSGYKALRKQLKKRPDSIVIFNFGVNDIGRGYNRKAAYKKLLNKIHKNYPRALLCFMSVNPVKSSSRNPYAKSSSRARKVNKKIRSFNLYISRNLPLGSLYINSSQALNFRYKDGLHYTNNTYRNIAYYVIGKRKLSQK